MALTKTLKPSKTTTTSIIKTRAQSRTTGTNDRTIDSVDPVVPTTTETAGRTNDLVDPVAVADAARRTTTLKDPPPVPTGMKPAPRVRTMDPDSEDDANKKPAAKPTKGRPKKVAPNARKPRKPRNVDANDLVDPMANIHVDDATGVVTAGGLARAGGNDPEIGRAHV